MRRKRSLTVLMAVIALTIFGLGPAATQGDNQENKQPTTIGYKIKGSMDPVPGHSFPKSWGRVVTYFVQPTGAGHRFLVFEAADGTIRMVRVDLDWDKHRIEDADVITIGRD
ncbi:MAG TPA: hypothetical protein VI750_13160 [Pyrinomonadaceae bacterium]|nr:hypothetical protein [Pyrinomonadaceae bacterium]